MRHYPARSELQIPDTWARAEGRAEGAPLLIRLRSALDPITGHPEFSNRLIIGWSYLLDQDQVGHGL